MIPGSTPTSILQNYLRTQQGVIESVRVSPDQILLTVGERVQATVTGQLPNGRFAVLIKDQLLDLNLPRNTQPGEQLDLTVAGKSPRLTFIFTPQTPLGAEPGVKPGVDLSSGAKLLSELFSAKNTPAAATLQQSVPLIQAEPEPAQLAQQLAGRLAESGLFYESHQAEWAQGERTLQTLLREPQAQQPAVRHPDHSASRLPQSIPAALAESDAQPIPAARAEILQKASPEVQNLVQQQLAVLEDKPLVWLGQAWEGQPLRWETELKNERDARSQMRDEDRVWQTRLDLALPKLGELGVTATLRDQQFQLRFASDNPQTQALLQANLRLLGEHFAAAGLNLTSVQVGASGHEEG